jgi:hypothetical protein
LRANPHETAQGAQAIRLERAAHAPRDSALGQAAPNVGGRRHQLRLAIDIGLARGAEFLQAILVGAPLKVFRAHAVDEHHARLVCGDADHLR